MKYYLIIDFGVKVECSEKQKWWDVLGYPSWEDVLDANGGVEPDVEEITEKEYEYEGDGLDCA